MFKNRILLLALLSATALAQTGASAFSTGARATTPEMKPLEPAMTTTVDGAREWRDLLPQPVGKPTLMGGTLRKLDQVRDELTLDLFGGGKVRILYDARTHVYRDGLVASADDLQNGERVYVDTVMAGESIFAQNIRMKTRDASGESSGQVVSYDPGNGSLVLSDAMAPRQLKLRVAPTTIMSRDGKEISRDDLATGSLVSVEFEPNAGGEPTARAISILASPGNTFVFVGRVVQLDLHLGLLVVTDPRDQKTYEISFDPNTSGVSDRLREGTTVEAVTRFDGGRYMASAIKVDDPK